MGPVCDVTAEAEDMVRTDWGDCSTVLDCVVGPPYSE